MSYVLVGCVSFLAGLLLASCMSAVLWRRLVRRLTAKRGLVATTLDLENRRVAYDSGRQHLARSTAGRPARISDGLSTRPGTLAKQQRVTRTSM